MGCVYTFVTSAACPKQASKQGSFANVSSETSVREMQADYSSRVLVPLTWAKGDQQHYIQTCFICKQKLLQKGSRRGNDGACVCAPNMIKLSDIT